MRQGLFLLIVVLAGACTEDEKPLLPGLPLNVASVKLQKSYRSNSETIIANGINAVQLEFVFLNDTNFPVPVLDHPIEVWVNKKEQLLPTYSFTTTRTGTVEFSMRLADGTTVSESALKLSAVSQPELDSYRLPLVFHYFHVEQQPLSEHELDRIASVLTDSMTVLNKAFANARGSVDPNAIDANIEFYLAAQAPDGGELQHPGIEFIHVPGMTYEWDDLMKNINDGHYWLPSQYINVWILDLNGASGIAFYPEYESSESGYPSSIYGTLLQRNVLEQPLGPTLAHELAHMMDVRHVFGTDCLVSDDCEDTRAYARDPNRIFAGFSIVRTSCDYELFAATNYMDYPETEQNTFTRNQVQRMHHALGRTPFLPTPGNRNAGRKSAIVPLNDPRTSIDIKNPVID